MKIVKEVKAQKSHKMKYKYGIVYLPKEWIGKTVTVIELKEVKK